MLTTRAGGGDFINFVFAGEVEGSGSMAPFSLFPEEILVFRPRDEKNPPDFVDGLDDANDRMEDVPLAILVVDRGGNRCCWVANDG